MIDRVEVEGRTYQLVENFKNGFDKNAFIERYSDILARYDYIVGDWGYEQLRLKGFFDDHHAQATRETKISYLKEYLNEYCNFDCAYFVLKKEN